VRSQGNRSIVLDATELAFLDSTGLGVLVTVQRDLAAANGTLVVRGASRSVRRVFEITGLDGTIILEG
jgi:anti-sigma B factor antagonist